VAGGAVAQEASDEPSQEFVANENAQQAEAAADAMWRDAAQRAESGALKADVDQAEAARVLQDAINPPTDTKAAEELEADMIQLTAKLRASGDLPSLDDPSRFGEVAFGQESGK